MRVRIIQPTKTQEKSLKKVCAYARVSTDSESQGESLENQITYYQALIEANPEYQYVGVFADRGITGTKDKRPEFQRMLDLAKQSEIDLILTKSVSRFARNTTIVLEIVRELKELGVEVKFEKENISTLSGDGELMLTVLSSFAQEESKNVSDNIKWRFQQKFKKGELLLNTKRFLGYDKDPYGDLVINPQEAKIIQRIYTEYLAGKGCFKLAKILNAEGVPTVTGANWGETSILEILKNEKYKGDAFLQKTYVADHLSKQRKRNMGEVDSFYIEENHSPIITKEVWEAVQLEMKKRAQAYGNFKGSTKYQNRYPLTGMLYCSKCGATLKRRVWNSKASCRKIVWQCSNYVKNGKAGCSGTSIEDKVIINIKINSPIIIKEVIRDGQKHYSYSSKGQQDKPCWEFRTPEKENGGLLPGIYRPTRTVI